jgi:hypothetical protein
LARLSKAKSLWTNAVYSNKATGDGDECGNNASPETCRICVVNEKMPVCDADSNASVTRVTMPA